ncbi:MAG: C69 family dipeptidase [Lachnospiraceae bacterium]|nr:C69 family dipeptidase [Lachnospiraceae bacterium]
MLKRIMAMSFFAAAIVLVSAKPVMACTGVYVGKKASADGTVIIARSSDNQAVWGNHVTVTERVENVPGRKMQVDMDGTVFSELPDTTYKYTAAPFLSSTMAANSVANDAGACANEYGVAMTMAVTAYANEDALSADPLIDSGLTENTAADLVICQSRSAREAVKVLLSLIDRYGSSEGNIAFIADQNEAWYVEMYTGHQYAAVLLPEDRVCVFGNEFTLEYLSDYREKITSPGLESLPLRNGFSYYGRRGELNIFDTYSGEKVTQDYCHMRTWIGHKVLAPKLYGGDYDAGSRYPLCFPPGRKVGLADVCALLRNRYEGTAYDPDVTGRTDMRVIGTDTAMSVHALQIYDDLPARMSCVTWESVGPAIYGVFVPISNASLYVSEAYGKDQPETEAFDFNSDDFPYYAFKELTTLCVEREEHLTYGKPVRDYWMSAEEKMRDGMGRVLEDASRMKNEDEAGEYITGYCTRSQTLAFSDAKSLLNKVIWTQSGNGNTLKSARDPDTGALLGHERVLAPMKAGLDPAGYSYESYKQDISSKIAEPTYSIRKVSGAADWKSIPELDIDRVLWTDDYGIRAKGQLCYDEENLYVHLSAAEKDIRAENTEPLSPVYEDSCLEFFFMPGSSDDYFNFEINPNGVLNIGFGPKKTDRINIARSDAKDYFGIETERTEDGWEASYRIPLKFIRVFCPDFSFSGDVAANMYKCGNKTVHKHYLSWTQIDLEEPNFHCPQFFGTMYFE